jgi:hypothetical protein
VGHFQEDHENVHSDEWSGLLSLSLQYGFGIEACPLCGESDTIDSPELIAHVLEHMHQFSLLSLPWSRQPIDIRTDDRGFSPSHPRLLWSPEKTNDIDQRNIHFEAVRVIDRLIPWLDSDAVKLPVDVADSENSRRKIKNEKVDDEPDFFAGKLYFADQSTNASVRVGTLLEGNDSGNEGTSWT